MQVIGDPFGCDAATTPTTKENSEHCEKPFQQAPTGFRVLVSGFRVVG